MFKITPAQYLGLLALIATCVGYLLLTTPRTPAYDGADADGRQYLAMAGDPHWAPKFLNQTPWCYRVATPYIASQLPGDNHWGKFKTVAVIDSVLALLLMFGILHALGTTYWGAMLGVALYAGVFWTVKFAYYSPCYIDHMTQVAALLVLWVMLRKWWFLLPIVFFAGAFQKESIAGLAPVVMVYFLVEKGLRWWPLYALGVLLVVAIKVPPIILAQLCPDCGPMMPANEVIAKAWEIAWTTVGLSRVIVLSVFSGLGLIPLFLFLDFGWLMRYLRRHPHWLVMILVGTVMLFGGVDKSRLYLCMLPAIVVMGVAALEQLHARVPRERFWLFVGALLLLHVWVGSWFSSFEIFEDYMDLMVPEYSRSQGDLGFTRALIATIAVLLLNYFLIRPAKSASALPQT